MEKAIKTISVVIPLGRNESKGAQIPICIQSHPKARDAFEVVLVLPEEGVAPPWASLFPCSVVYSSEGRAAQLNEGAKRSIGDLLWFVHADSEITYKHLDELLAKGNFLQENSVLGYFPLAFHDGPALIFLNQFFGNVRAKFARMPFGDQGFALSRNSFVEASGFPSDFLSGEDHAFIQKLRRKEFCFYRFSTPLATSARKYIEHGYWKTTAKHLLLTLKQELLG